MDATGRHKTAYTYSGSLLAGESYPNGGALSYSYDSAGNVNAITQSTAEGEANTNTTLYTAGEVTRLTSGNNTVDYAYDGHRRLTSVKLNGANHVSYAYTDANAETAVPDSVTTTYANGYAVTATYDGFGRLTKTAEGETVLTEMTYTPDGRITEKIDHAENCTHTFTYDGSKRLTGYEVGWQVSEERQYDTEDRCTLRNVSVGMADQNYTQTYTYDDVTHRLAATSITYPYAEGTIVSAPKYDAGQRYTGKKVTFGNKELFENSISYLKHGDHATSLPQSVRYAYGSQYGNQETESYTYDAMGNITAVYENGLLMTRYTYDSLNRLVREDNRVFGKTSVFVYDANGNILCRRLYAFTLCSDHALAELTPTEEKKYAYDGDRLMSYDGATFAYDALGNPTTYRGKTLRWSKGRLLTAYDTRGISYDGFGRRWGAYDAEGRLLYDTAGFVCSYDETGLCGAKFIGNSFYYIFQKDALGNIRAILDTNGNIVVKYKYDAWGNCKVLDANGNEIPEDYTDEMGMPHIGYLNPFRYRGYYYDVNTGLYYLQSRYYDPETGRFINADTVEYLDPKSINGLNLYAYCQNNPVMYVDYSGTSVTAILIGLGLLTLAGGIIGGVVGHDNGHTGWKLVADIVLGAGIGLAIGGAFVATTAVFAGAIAAISGATTATVFGGVAVSRAFAIGALAFNAFAYLIAPLFGIKMDGIEYEPYSIPY